MLKKLIMRYGNMIASLSLIVAVRFVFHSCRFLLHQPEEPEELKRLAYIRKYKKRVRNKLS